MAGTKIVIIGAGVMGQGLAEAIATQGTEVTLIDKTTRLAERGLKGIGESIDREIGKWGLTESDKRAIQARITPSSDLSLADQAEIVLEAIPEDLDKKRNLFEKLDTICQPAPVTAQGPAASILQLNWNSSSSAAAVSIRLSPLSSSCRLISSV